MRLFWGDKSDKLTQKPVWWPANARCNRVGSLWSHRNSLMIRVAGSLPALSSICKMMRPPLKERRKKGKAWQCPKIQRCLPRGDAPIAPMTWQTPQAIVQLLSCHTEWDSSDLSRIHNTYITYIYNCILYMFWRQWSPIYIINRTYCNHIVHCIALPQLKAFGISSGVQPPSSVKSGQGSQRRWRTASSLGNRLCSFSARQNQNPSSKAPPIHEV